MHRTFNFQIETACHASTIYNYLRSKSFSRQSIIALKKIPESILLNGKWCYVNEKLSAGDCLTIHLIEKESSENIVPCEIPLDIVYEDEDILILNKPANMPVHPSLNHYEGTLANGVVYYYEKQGIPYVFRCTNRLDKDTSGLILLSKHMVAAGILSTMIAAGHIKREYLALVSQGKEPLPKEGTVNAPIARMSDSLITRCVDFQKGERAVTHYRKLQEKNGYDLISLHLETGRTHQIRVHMSYLGHPLLGDSLYYGNMELIKRQALHSYRLSFPHPITKEPMTFTAPVPPDMEKLI
ncbi:MAG: RluA family pseudouridine synthase [Lachnospiraceae bacterium]|nr:RluA family pseudouridine synthase [Lachnospiraceae bacterium]